MNTPANGKRRAILAFVLNRSGVLNKISMLIRRKMYNVDTLTVCATYKRPGVSRMTLTLKEDSDAKALQIIKQLERMTEVISAKELDIDQSFWREVAVVKFEATAEDIQQLQQTHDLDVLSHQNEEICVVQIAGKTHQIDDFIEDLGEEKIIEVARSGLTAMER